EKICRNSRWKIGRELAIMVENTPIFRATPHHSAGNRGSDHAVLSECEKHLGHGYKRGETHGATDKKPIAHGRH
ncbi:MAG: hypothetical protein LUF77_03550, partial [Oscillospiraceae bacterium]|nr:hypothetical protein [Oscillospiraceae bacterium]